MDVRNMSFDKGHFDTVIDKGLLDAIVCGDGAHQNVNLMLDNIYRVLSDTGTYICVSHGTEAERKKYLKNLKKWNWQIIKYPILKPGLGVNPRESKHIKHDDKDHYNFIYVCRKQSEPVQDSDLEEEKKQWIFGS